MHFNKMAFNIKVSVLAHYFEAPNRTRAILAQSCCLNAFSGTVVMAHVDVRNSKLVFGIEHQTVHTKVLFVRTVGFHEI